LKFLDTDGQTLEDVIKFVKLLQIFLSMQKVYFKAYYVLFMS